MTVRLFNACSTAGTTDTPAEHWNGTEWNLQTMPNPAAGKINGLSGVACTPTATCVAIGSL